MTSYFLFVKIYKKAKDKCEIVVKINTDKKYMHTANWILFWRGLNILIVAAAPMLLFITAIVLRDLLIAILMFFMLLCTDLIHPWLGAILGEAIE